jgi:hypothetical protein
MMRAGLNYRFLAVVFCGCWLVAAGCGQKPASKNLTAPVPVVLKVAVLSDGRLLADAQPTTLSALRELLDRLRSQGGVVWYYREGSDQEPPSIAMEVMKAVVDAGVPIRLSSRPDYSDAIGSDGVPVNE